MQMQVVGAFAKGDGVHAITACESLKQLRGLLNGAAPGRGLFGVEGDRSTDVSVGIKQQPARQGCRIRMVAQDPKGPRLIS